MKIVMYVEDKRGCNKAALDLFPSTKYYSTGIKINLSHVTAVLSHERLIIE